MKKSIAKIAFIVIMIYPTLISAQDYDFEKTIKGLVQVEQDEIQEIADILNIDAKYILNVDNIYNSGVYDIKISFDNGKTILRYGSGNIRKNKDRNELRRDVQRDYRNYTVNIKADEKSRAELMDEERGNIHG